MHEVITMDDAINKQFNETKDILKNINSNLALE